MGESPGYKTAEVLGIWEILSRGLLALILRSGETALPLFIGEFEAAAINSALVGNRPLRPMTHDLIVRLLAAGQAELKEVGISELVDSTFIGYLGLQYPGAKTLTLVDCRPSDAIALALRVGCPIKVAETVLQQAGQPADVILPKHLDNGCHGCRGCGQAETEPSGQEG